MALTRKSLDLWEWLQDQMVTEVVATLMVIIALMPTIRDVSQTKIDGAKPKLI
jgi:hypothetical protein